MLTRPSRKDAILLAALASTVFTILLLGFAQTSSALTGQLDTHFAADGSVQLVGYDPFMQARDQLAVAPDGSFAVVSSVGKPARKSFDGTITFDGGRWSVSRFTKDGTRDSRFGTNGRVVLRFPGEHADYPRASIATSVSFDRQGRLLVAGAVDHMTFAEYQKHSGRSPTELAFADVQNDFLAVARLTRRGKPDRTFGNHGLEQIRLYRPNDGYGPAFVRAVGLAQLPSGRVIVGAENVGPAYGSFGVFALTAAGKPISGFGNRGRKIVPNARLLRVGSGGRIFTGGLKFRGPNAANAEQLWSVTKLRSDGTLDRRFGRNGVSDVKTKFNIRDAGLVPLVNASSIDIAPDGLGRVLVTGALSHGTAGYSVLAVARLGSSGALDKSFGRSGFARVPLGTNTSSSGSSVVTNRRGEIFTGGTINTVPFNDPWELGGMPFSQGVVVKFDSRGRPAKKWAHNAVEQMTSSGVKSCPYGPLLTIQQKRILASGCWRDPTWGVSAEVFRLKN